MDNFNSTYYYSAISGIRKHCALAIASAANSKISGFYASRSIEGDKEFNSVVKKLIGIPLVLNRTRYDDDYNFLNQYNPVAIDRLFKMFYVNPNDEIFNMKAKKLYQTFLQKASRPFFVTLLKNLKSYDEMTILAKRYEEFLKSGEPGQRALYLTITKQNSPEKFEKEYKKQESDEYKYPGYNYFTISEPITAQGLLIRRHRDNTLKTLLSCISTFLNDYDPKLYKDVQKYIEIYDI